jgi:regulator of sirC expression with transglutaminase-like and TPR domain
VSRPRPRPAADTSLRYPWAVVPAQLLERFSQIALSPDPDLAVAALMIARVAYPTLDATHYLDRLDGLGREAADRVAAIRVDELEIPMDVDPLAFARVTALNQFLFRDLQFVGNDVQYEDPRNSFLNDVLDRRTGIPITLALVYMEVARRAGVDIEGVNFPGHFLMRCRVAPGTPYRRDLIIDAHHGGALLTEAMCRELLHKHAGDGIMWDQQLLGHATKPQILARMLLNLKRSYVRMYSFPQAKDITEMLLAVDPAALTELRDRGLLAYHLNDFSAALRDLQHYLQLSSQTGGSDDRDEHEQIWEHVKTLRRRVASLN